MSFNESPLHHDPLRCMLGTTRSGKTLLKVHCKTWLQSAVPMCKRCVHVTATARWSEVGQRSGAKSDLASQLCGGASGMSLN